MMLAGVPQKRLETRKMVGADRICKSLAIAADSVEFKAINYTLLQQVCDPP